MATYMTYCRNLGFEEDPNYAYLRRLFRDLYHKCHLEFDFIFDWTIQKFRPMNEDDDGQISPDEEEKGRDRDVSTIPESLKGHRAMGSDIEGGPNYLS